MFRHAVRVLLALAFALAPARSDAKLYRWVDEVGVTRYATDLDSIPSDARDAAVEIAVTPAPVAARRAATAPAPVEAAPIAPPATEVAAPASTPATEPAPATPTEPPVFPGPAATPAIPDGDPRAAEVAELEARIAADREYLRQLISTKRWDSAELASDPSIREIAERLPRLQAELAALRAETVP